MRRDDKRGLMVYVMTLAVLPAFRRLHVGSFLARLITYQARCDRISRAPPCGGYDHVSYGWPLWRGARGAGILLARADHQLCSNCTLSIVWELLHCFLVDPISDPG